MSYVFDVSSAAASRLPPRIITHGLAADEAASDAVLPEEFTLLRGLLLQKRPPPAIDESAVGIFEDVGADYHFRPKATGETPGGGSVLHINPVEFASLRERDSQAAATIPAAVESILQTAASPMRDEEQDTAYPIMGYDYNDGDDDDGNSSRATTASGATKPSKRQRLRREAQKLDKQVRQVTKLMEGSSSKRDERA